MSEVYFDHEKLKVYQKSLDYVEWVFGVLDSIKSRNSIIDQIERASESILLNIAEGNGKYSGKDKCRYFDISRGSSLECAACLDVMFKKKLIDGEIRTKGKLQLKEIVSMLIGLIKANSDRVYEPDSEYNT
ncbi:MAG: four helix bundle protein [Melioribacteraceae bacterium]